MCVCFMCDWSVYLENTDFRVRDAATQPHFTTDVINVEKLQRHVISKQRVEDVVISVDVSGRDLSDDVTRLAIGADADVEGGRGERGFVGVARHLDGDECRGGWSR